MKNRWIYIDRNGLKNICIYIYRHEWYEEQLDIYIDMIVIKNIWIYIDMNGMKNIWIYIYRYEWYKGYLDIYR